MLESGYYRAACASQEAWVSLGPIRRQNLHSDFNRESLRHIITSYELRVMFRCKKTLYSTLELKESTQGKTHIEDCPLPTAGVQLSTEKVQLQPTRWQ